MQTTLTSTGSGIEVPHRKGASDRGASVSFADKRTNAIEVGFLLTFGFVCRLMAMTLILKQHPPAWLFSRGMEMGLMATSILNGEGLSSPFGGHTGHTALIGPLYPFMVAAIFRVAGSYTLAAEIVVLVIQVLVGVLNIWLVIRIANRIGGQQAGFFAGLFWACSPPLLFMPTIFWDTTFTACVLTGMVFLAFTFADHPTKRLLLYAGALFGMASLLNSALFFTSLALIAFMASQLRTDRLKDFCLAVLLFVATFSPWPIRNAFVMHAFIPFRTTVGLELWMGNHEGSTGHLDEKLFPIFNANELAEYTRVGEIAYNREKTRLAEEYVRNNPSVFASLTLKRIVRYWLGTGSRDESPSLALHAMLTTALGFAGLIVFTRRRHERSVLSFLLPMLLFPLPYYITHAEFRYRLVIDPLLTAFAGYALVVILQSIAERRFAMVAREDEETPSGYGNSLKLPIARFMKEESGQTAIVAAACLVALISFVGLVIDLGNLRYQQRRLQAAADSAALAAALELQACGTSNNCSAMQQAAKDSIGENSYTGATAVTNCAATAGGGLTLMVNNPVCVNGASDPNAGNRNYVEVLMKQYEPTYFARIFGFSTIPVTARAEATRAPAPCIYALDRTGINAITVDALAVLKAQCPIVDESNSPYAFGCNVLAAVSATMIRVTGGTEGLLCLGVNPPPEVNAPIPTPADPLAYLPKPAIPSTCTGSPTLGLLTLQILGTATLYPGRYCGGIVIGPLANVTFEPGVYELTSTGLLGIPLLGGLTITAGATVNGTGVTFYNYGPANGLTGGITFVGTLPLIGNVNLVAPTTGTYAGILFFQDPNDTAPASLVASIGGATTLQGAFYFPTAQVTYAVSGNSKFNILVAKDIDFAVLSVGATAYEQSVFGNDYSSLPGGSPIPATGAVLAQ